MPCSTEGGGSWGKPKKQRFTFSLGFKDGFNTIFRIQKEIMKCSSAVDEVISISLLHMCPLEQFCMEGQRSTKVSFYCSWAKFCPGLPNTIPAVREDTQQT